MFVSATTILTRSPSAIANISILVYNIFMTSEFTNRRNAQLDAASGQHDNGEFRPNLTPGYLTPGELELYPETSLEAARKVFGEIAMKQIEQAAATFREDPAGIKAELSKKFDIFTDPESQAAQPTRSSISELLSSNAVKIAAIEQNGKTAMFESALNHASDKYELAKQQTGSDDQLRDHLSLLQQIIDNLATPDELETTKKSNDGVYANVVPLFNRKPR